jgi:hypothetical protein
MIVHASSDSLRHFLTRLALITLLVYTSVIWQCLLTRKYVLPIKSKKIGISSGNQIPVVVIAHQLIPGIASELLIDSFAISCTLPILQVLSATPKQMTPDWHKLEAREPCLPNMSNFFYFLIRWSTFTLVSNSRVYFVICNQSVPSSTDDAASAGNS